MDNVCSAYQKASIFIMRKGSGGEHCLVFNIREREAGRSVSRMDNACHTAPPPSRLAHNPYNVTVSPFAPMLRNRGQKLRF